MAGHFVTQFMEGLRHFTVLLQGGCHAKYGQRQATLFKLTQDAPHACTAAVFVNAFHAHVALWVGRRVEHFRQKLLAGRIAMQHAVFATFFVVQHKLHGNTRLAGPLGMGRVAAIANQVTG